MSRAALLDRFAFFPARLRDAVLAVADRPVPPGEWNPTEVVRRLIVVEHEVHQARLRQLTVEDDPQWSWTEPGLANGFDDAHMADVLEAFDASPIDTVALVRALTDDGWARRGTDATYGRLDVEVLVRLASDRDAVHLEALIS